MSAQIDENPSLFEITTRESGDGESSETSPHTSEDDQEATLTPPNRKLLAKPSKIPVRLAKKLRKAQQKPIFNRALFPELDIPIPPTNLNSLQRSTGVINKSPSPEIASPDKALDGSRNEFIMVNSCERELSVSPNFQAGKSKPNSEIILEAPEEFQTTTNCDLDLNPPTHDDDKTKSSPEANSISMYGQESNKDVTLKNVERGIETGNAPNLNTTICITNIEEKQCSVPEKQTVCDIFSCIEGDLKNLFEVGGFISNGSCENLVVEAEGQLSAACAGNEQILATVKASIEVGVAGCAQAPRCSRISATTVCAVTPADPSQTAGLTYKKLETLNNNNNNVTRKCCSDCDSSNDCKEESAKYEKTSANSNHLIWKFVNGRLIFETSPDVNDENAGDDSLLSSRDLNKRVQNHISRLKLLENKLKQAGLTDGKEEQVVDDAPEDSSEEESSLEIFENCEFDVREVDSFASNYCLIYDELLHDQENEVNYHINNTDNSENAMGTTDEERAKQHNPDRENLKSLLKKPGRDKDLKKNRVVFNETKNEFFDADYIILIREECDYDDEDDEGVCTCNDHEMVRLTCCEPNCNCNSYEEYNEQTPQSPKFAPPLEFVDAVTLSPPEGYKDMELGEQQLLALQQMARRGQRAAVCRDCSATHDDEGSLSDNENNGEAPEQDDTKEDIPKTDQSQQTTPTTPPSGEKVTSHESQFGSNPPQIITDTLMCDREEDLQRCNSPNNSPITGILKGGRLWKQSSQDITNIKEIELHHSFDTNITSDDEGNNNKRSVRFYESDNKRDSCDGAVDKPIEELPKPTEENKPTESLDAGLNFKLGSHIYVNNKSLKPNSAVRQLFPQSELTADALRTFEETKRSKLPQIIQSDETDESIKRAIERNTLRRSLIRYDPKPKKKEQKTDSLVERIKQLTCDVDELGVDTEDMPPRASPTGEEARKSPEISSIRQDKSFSPSSSSTTSSNSSSSTYKKITDLFAKREKPDIQTIAPDLGNQQEYTTQQHCAVTRSNSSSDTRKQFLSTLAPLTACVTSTGAEDYFYNRVVQQHGADRSSVTSSVGTEYSLEDIDEGLKNEEEVKRNTPDVICGTPVAPESGDELAMFVQQDASRIERIKKKYQHDNEDDENDDYGFNKRPSVRGIKPKFGTTNEILQQIQNQLQPPQTNTKTWPYYSEANLSNTQDNKQRLPQQHFRYVTPNEVNNAKVFRPTSLTEDNIYQNCANQRCNSTYRTTANHPHSPIMRIGGGCNEIYCQVVPNRPRNGRPESPPPLEIARNVHQTMVYIPYNHIESYQPGCLSPNPAVQYASTVRVVNHNQINNRLYLEPIYQNQRVPQPAKTMVRIPYPDNSIPGQFARSTQTATSNYYPRYRPTYHGDPNIVYSRHSYPRYPPDSVSLTDSESPLLNGYRYETTFSAQKDSAPSSPTKSRFIERGVPEGAASVSPQDTQNTSTMTSPTSPQNMQGKPVFYAMNV